MHGSVKLKEENARLREQVAEHAKRIAELERQLAVLQQNSPTSSKPPHPRDSRAGNARAAAGGRVGASPAVNRGIPGIGGRWCRSSA